MRDAEKGYKYTECTDRHNSQSVSECSRFKMKALLVIVLASALLCVLQSYPVEVDLTLKFDPDAEDQVWKVKTKHPENETELSADSMDISTLLEKANANLDKIPDGTVIRFGDIAVDPLGSTNADPCTERSCKWPQSPQGTVYIPFEVSNDFSLQDRAIIEGALSSFAQYTCIEFIRRTNERDYISVQSLSGCYSFIGRRGGRQALSLNRRGCVYHQVVQHEFLHALGFNHEQTRSDRDSYVNILYENIQRGMEYNFNRVNTNNLGTPYDYDSVMHYGRYAFSSNGRPTIEPIPDPNVSIGRAVQFSQIDIERVNRLYNCRNYL
ncbi:high choriolytic enzyme 1-like [Acipenser oxyrinchus oxyrinchus]|uniref:Metalloendopeptidase n=1 Tax=Acipenser oxyrinchus oxyrinchus TaxID=40147 RepID=A0AAD8CZH0_ACIOX|nr:high choriolytic enzyme 1-like [Acipenser oxyrinchus oxyrinchus]